jgi:D-alanyl-D-alanine dipeptidase
MPGLVPGIHVLPTSPSQKNVDGRDKPGHDDVDHLSVNRSNELP